MRRIPFGHNMPQKEHAILGRTEAQSALFVYLVTPNNHGPGGPNNRDRPDRGGVGGVVWENPGAPPLLRTTSPPSSQNNPPHPSIGEICNNHGTGGNRYPTVTHLPPGTWPCKTFPKPTLNTNWGCQIFARSSRGPTRPPNLSRHLQTTTRQPVRLAFVKKSN